MSIVMYSARAYATAEKIDLIEFSREIDNLQYFILQNYIAKFPALEVSKAQFNELLHIIRREGQYFHAISNDYSFIKDRYHFYIEERSKATEFETALTPYPRGDFQEIDLPATGQIVIRKRQPGDRIQVNGIDKKLRRYFIDNKVALKKRVNPLVVVENVVYGVLDVVTADLSKSLKHDKMKRTLYYREKRYEDRMLEKTIERILVSEEEICAKSKELGQILTAVYADKNPLMVAILKGSVPFFAELTKRIDAHIEMDFMVVSSYHGGTSSSGEVKMIKDLDTSVEGRDIVIVEDIIDTGRTLLYLKELLLHRKAKSVKIVTLVDKPEGRVVDIEADYVGFTLPNEFLVGFGLDYDEHYRNLPYIGILKEEIYQTEA